MGKISANFGIQSPEQPYNKDLNDVASSHKNKYLAISKARNTMIPQNPMSILEDPFVTNLG